MNDKSMIETMFNAGPPAIIADAQLRIVQVNQACLQLFGFPENELLNGDLEQFYRDQDETGFVEFLEEVGRSPADDFPHRTFQGKTRRNTWTGEPRDLVETLTSVFDAAGRLDYVLLNYQDITGLVSRDAACQEAERSVHLLVESLPDPVLVMYEGTIVDCNLHFERLVQDQRAAIVGRAPMDFSPSARDDDGDERERLERIFAAIAKGRPGHFEWQLESSRGETRATEVTVSSFQLNGRSLVFANVRDITARKKMELERQTLLDELARKEEMTRLATRAGGIAVWEADIASDRVSWSQGAEALFGMEVDDLPVTLEAAISLVVEGDQGDIHRTLVSARAGRPFQAEVRVQRADGQAMWLRTQGLADPVPGGAATKVRGVVSDITDYMLAQQEISRLAYYDPLTKLGNRRLLMDRLKQHCASAKRNGTSGLVYYLDMDRFKLLNDSLGHASGDLLLQQVAAKLNSIFRVEDTVARLGGDEFVVVVPTVPGDLNAVAKTARVIAEKLRATLADDYEINGRGYHMSSSIGIAIFPQDADTAEGVLHVADAAMYQAKNGGRDAAVFYRHGLQGEADQRLALVQDLREARGLGQLQLYYQPKVGPGSTLVGAEALLRWRHPTRGLVLPGNFIAVAEESGLIEDLGEWALAEACRQFSRWRGQGLAVDDFSVSVNISPVQFRQQEFAEAVKNILADASVPPSAITLEITEGTLIENVEDTVEKLHELKSIGVNISIDDFGTGYSSLYYLKRLPLDEIKIDRAYVGNIIVDRDDAAIVQTILDIARHFSLSPVAEGVETAEQAACLRRLGCEVHQGYYYAKPMTGKEFFEVYLVPLAS